MCTNISHNQFLEIGRILKPFGIKGYLKVHLYIDSSEDLHNIHEFYVKEKGKNSYKALPFSSLIFEDNPEYAKVFFPEISNRTLAENWRLTPIFIKQEDLNLPEDGSFFIKDLIGLQSFYNNQLLGKVINVLSIGNSEIFIITLADSKVDLAVPFSDHYVEQILLSDQKIDFKNIDELL
ncbi:MAG: ribosome maturation factor RimM [Brevinemataceae bacterium]